MKILIIMDPGIPIPVKGYGGHERLVEMFAKEYVKLGHKVDLLVTNGSYVTGCRVFGLGDEGFPQTKIQRRKTVFAAWKFLWKQGKEYDLIHNFGRLIYLLPVLNKKVHKIMTYGREISTRNIRYIQKLPNNFLSFTGCSTNLINRAAVKGNWHTVYNAIEFNKYTSTQDLPVDAPLMFLGRIEKIKGCHTAIEVAKATNSQLIIAGNISPLTEEAAYFKNEIEPHIDGSQIKYVGTVNDEQKNEWLGKAKALLMPIEWDEPFGIVMIEAMACGTPVIAFKKGSVPEVVSDSVTGFIVNTKDEMIVAVGNLHLIDRKQCRERAELQFDVPVVAKNYLSLA